MPRTLQTQTRWGTLARVFSVRADKELHSLIACLCVLFEDLRIELHGQTSESLQSLDECGVDARKFYFLRRSLATLHEFATVIQELDRLPSFQPTKAKLDVLAQRNWKTAVAYFKKHDVYIARVRNNVGGHFGKSSARLGITNLLPNSLGALEVIFTDKGGGAKLLFAHEIVATAALQHVPGPNISAKSRRLIRHAAVAYRKAAWAMDCITAHYLWDRFGK